MAIFGKKCGFRAVQRSALCRSRRELSNAYLVAKFGFDTAENEPSKVGPILHISQDEAPPFAGLPAAARPGPATAGLDTFVTLEWTPTHERHWRARGGEPE